MLNSCPFFLVLLKGLQDVVESPPSTKVIVVGSRSANASPSPVTALQIPVQIPVQITHVCEYYKQQACYCTFTEREMKASHMTVVSVEKLTFVSQL